LPKFLETALKAEAAKKGMSGREAARYTFGAMNNMGAMHGSAETAKGAAMQHKHDEKMERQGHARGGMVGPALRIAKQVASPKPFPVPKEFKAPKKLASGGMSSFDMMRPPYLPIQSREAIYEESRGRPGGITEPLGKIASTIPGRTDRIPASVGADSYVLPADVVSGIGEGNTDAGAALIHKMLFSGPYAVQDMRVHEARGVGIPRAPDPYQALRDERVTEQPEQPWFAAGGRSAKGKKPDGADRPRLVPVILAGGEMVIPPQIVKYHPRLGNGDMKQGHRILDAFVRHARAEHIKTLKKLPGPHK
jgi:hypothetical protein